MDEQTNTTKYPGDKPLDSKKHVWENFNYWYEQLLDRAIMYRQALKAHEANPNKTIRTNSGVLSVMDICERRQQALTEAKEYVASLTEILEAIGEQVEIDDNLNVFFDDTLPTGAVRSPLQDGGEGLTPVK